MRYRNADWQQFLIANNRPRPLEVLGFLSDFEVSAKCFTDVKFEDIELDVVATWEDTSFSHNFGTKHQGYYDVHSIFFNDTMLPLALISDETIQKLMDLINGG